MRIPRHLAIIMDGNGRWAQQRSLPRIFGHRRGVETVRQIVEECSRLDIPYLTLYAFSYENWGRPDEEVGALMELLTTYLGKELDTMLSHGIRLNVVGDIRRLPRSVRQMLENSLARTESNSGMTLTLALSYGSRDELVRAMRRVGEQIASGKLSVSAIDEAAIAAQLDTADMPDPDFLIRTSGEMRISNFLLWQLAYAELFFTETLWPDFSREHLHAALGEFARRDRRFGLTGDQKDKRKGREPGNGD